MNKNLNVTANNIFYVMCYIIQNPEFSLLDIVSFLEYKGVVVECETAQKYIRTLKKLGFVFEKINNKTFILKNYPFEYKCDQEKIFRKLAEGLPLSGSAKSFSLLCKLLRFSDWRKSNVLKNFFVENFKSDNVLNINWNNYLKDLLRLDITFWELKNVKKNIVFELYDIFIQNDTTYMKGFNVTDKVNLILDVNKIISIEQMPVKNKFMFAENEVCLAFSGKLAQSYILKNNEEIISDSQELLTIKTFCFDKKNFFNRILRYQDKCEILSPAYLRKDFKKYVQDLYQMYDCHIEK